MVTSSRSAPPARLPSRSLHNPRVGERASAARRVVSAAGSCSCWLLQPAPGLAPFVSRYSVRKMGTLVPSPQPRAAGLVGLIAAGTGSYELIQNPLPRSLARAISLVPIRLLIPLCRPATISTVFRCIRDRERTACAQAHGRTSHQPAIGRLVVSRQRGTAGRPFRCPQDRRRGRTREG